MSESTNRESDKFMLRLPDGMREEIKREAEAAGRSMNAEIVSALSFHLEALHHDRQFKAAQAAWDADGGATMDQYPGIDVGQLPATKHDLERILRQIQELMSSK